MAEAPFDRPSAGATPLHRAYRQLAKRLHPDAGGSDLEMARLADAYTRLASPAEPVASPQPSLVRAPRRLPLPPLRLIQWSHEAEQFTRFAFRPQAR